MITLSDKFKRDISYPKTNVYPIIIIDNQYYISTIKEYLEVEEEKILFEDYGLNVSKLKEAISVKNSTFNISNITINLNNYKLKEERFSDLLIDKTNKPIQIYYKSQSCTSIEDCLLVFSGTIRRITHNNLSISLVLEDLTQIKLNKEVPIANLGYSKNVFNENYINRPIPITYGFVEKAPVVPWIDNTEVSGVSEFSIIADDVGVVTGNDRGIFIEDFNNKNNVSELKFVRGDNLESPLLIYKDDYYRVLQKYDSSVEFTEEEDFVAFDSEQQYTINDSGQFLRIKKEFKGGVPNNAPAKNEFQTVKIQRPNQLELLVSENGVAEQGNVGSIINTSPITGILRPEAAIDSDDNPTTFFNSSSNISEFTTFATIPNNEISPENVQYFDDENFDVNLFSNYNKSNNKKGFLYPQVDDTTSYNSTHYLWLVNAWLQTNCTKLEDRKVKFINAPTGNMIVEKTSQKLNELGFKEEGVEIFTCYNNNATDDDLVKIYPQYAASSEFRDAWINSCVGITGNEIELGYEVSGTSGGFTTYSQTLEVSYFPDDVQQTLNPFSIDDIEFLQLYDKLCNTSAIFSGTEKTTTYPSTVYKINCVLTDTNNIQTIYIGQWDGSTMPQLSNNELWFNLFYDENNPDKDFLFNINDFATFVPYEQRGKHIDSDNRVLGTSYGAFYNGVAIGTEAGNTFSSGSSLISNEVYSGGYGYWTESSSKITMRELCDGVNGRDSNSGGKSWWMIVDGFIPKGEVFSDVSSTSGGYLNEIVDENCNLQINQGTLIPCGNKFANQLSGQNFSYDYLREFNPHFVTLTAGTTTVAEQRLSLFFPFGQLANADEETGYTNTFVYGALNVNIPSNSHLNLKNDDEFLVQAYATNEVSTDGLDFNAEYVGESRDATNLLKLENIGTDLHNETFVAGGNVSWDVNTFQDNADEEGNLFNDITNYRIEGWDSIDKINGLALVYRIRNNTPDSSSRLDINTNINSMGIIQYPVFNKVFDGNLYADVWGRYDDSDKYTLNGSTLIENPSDVIYHFLEKELELIDIMDLEKLEAARANNNDIKLAFSVNENINSKNLIEEIAKNTRLLPKFKSDSNFSFSTIKSTYNGSDLTIKTEDIIKFSFSRTNSEDIKTLVNVRYKKDYATGNFTRETGFCDGYDFFGNGEDGRSVYKNGSFVSTGYDYNFLGIERTDNIHHFESNYIRDYESAVQLRDYIYLLNCNQHTLIKCDLPLKYLELETGDVIDFDTLINNVKAFGEDYTTTNTRNGQLIYPYFIITSITKSSKNISLEAMQLHKLEGDFTCGTGSLSRRSELGINYFDIDNIENTPFNEHITIEDKEIMMDIISGLYTNLTSSQLISADITNDGSITQQDLNIMTLILDNTSNVIGDLTGDGVVNITDVIMLTNYIIGNIDDVELSILGDINLDGNVSVSDIIALVNRLLED